MISNQKLKDKGFTLCSISLPKYGKLCNIVLVDGSIITAWRTDSSFDEQLGYLYEDTNLLDHYQKDVVAWKHDTTNS